MSSFLKDDFLLTTKTARKLYKKFAADMPIIDYHCHVSPKEIYEDRRFRNITEIWLGGDHYKWRLMRSNGIDEKYITGSASDWEKFLAFAETLPKAIGNPMYHWCHLELKTYFGFNGTLNKDTAKEVWDLCEAKLKEPDMSVRGIIEKSGVAFIGTTDDPIDTLEYHKKLAEDKAMKAIVAPPFRPDKALNIDKAGWKEYIAALAAAAEIEINNVGDIKAALKKRIEYFDAAGCRASDHGLDKAVFEDYSNLSTDDIFKKGISGEALTAQEIDAFKTELLIFCAEEYARLGWVMQLHYNCLRNPNTFMFQALGADTGFDIIGPDNSCKKLAMFMDALYQSGKLPKTILYSLDPSDNQFIDTLLGAFQGTEAKGKIQHGSAWWFNDNKQGMTDQLISLLGNFVGMLTDSRSFLSYTRHEYFRRILCGLIGKWVEEGEYPNDEKALGEIIEGICFKNANQYFNINLEV